MERKVTIEEKEKQLLHKRHIVIATMHSKERVIAPILQNAFHVTCSVPELNTDLLGTFSGEVPRVDSALNTARKKCELALERSGCDVAVASEGSFGIHPTIPFVPGNEELVLLVDRKHRFELVGKHLTHLTNFSGKSISSVDEALRFAENAQFPSHGLILREGRSESDVFAKGIIEAKTLIERVSFGLSKAPQIWIETDMRAMYNPTRMCAIEHATKNLVDKLTSYCPNCGMPGFWITDTIKGLPCSLCHSPTSSTLATILECVSCTYTEQHMYPHQKQEEDPMYCDLCNP